MVVVVVRRETQKESQSTVQKKKWEDDEDKRRGRRALLLMDSLSFARAEKLSWERRREIRDPHTEKSNTSLRRAVLGNIKKHKNSK